MFTIKANIRVPHRFLRMNTKCIIIGGNDDKSMLWVIAVSRSGRKVETWVNAFDLGNYIPHWIKAEFGYGYCYETREEAKEVCDYLQSTFANKPIRQHILERVIK